MHKYFSNWSNSSRTTNILQHIENVLCHKFVKRNMLKYVYQDTSEFSKKLIGLGKEAYEMGMRKLHANHPIQIGSIPIGFFAQCVECYGVERIYKVAKTTLSDEEKSNIFFKLIGAVAFDCNWDPYIIEQTISLFDYYALSTFFEKISSDYIKKVHQFVLTFSKCQFFENLIMAHLFADSPTTSKFFCSLNIKNISFSASKFFYNLSESGSIRLELYHMMHDYLIREKMLNDNLIEDCSESIYLDADVFERWDGLLEDEEFCQ